MFDQMFKLLGIMAIPWCDGEPMDHTGVDIDTDVEFDAITSTPMSFNADVVPGTAVMSAESSGVHCDVHLFPSEKPGDPVHHLSNVGDGELFHPSLDHTMPRHIWTTFFDSLAIFEMRLDAIVGLIESYFEDTSYDDGLRVVCFTSFFVGFPGWWHAVNRFNHRLGEIGGEVAVHMVRNCWVYPFLCTSHPTEKCIASSLIIYFGMKPTFEKDL